MKKGIYILSSVLALVLLSFAPPQEKQAVRLKNGNYKLQAIKLQEDDVEKIQKLAEDITAWLYESESENEKEKDKYGRKKYEDLMSIFELTEGYQDHIAAFQENYITVFSNKAHKDVISTTLYKSNSEAMARGQERIDAIMKPYL